MARGSNTDPRQQTGPRKMPYDRVLRATPRQWNLLLLAWLLALASTAGSLFLSEVMDYVPCVLCWYQRIPMYALAVILGIALRAQDAAVLRYAQPLALLGLLLAAFHCLLYLGFIPKGIQPCGQGASCADVKLELWGFVTIPLMSLMAFAAIAVVLLLVKKESPYEAK